MNTHADSVCHARYPKSTDPKIHVWFQDMHTDVLISRRSYWFRVLGEF